MLKYRTVYRTSCSNNNQYILIYLYSMVRATPLTETQRLPNTYQYKDLYNGKAVRLY